MISVVIPDGIHNKEEWVNGLPLFKYGIAYDESPVQRKYRNIRIPNREKKGKSVVM